MNSATGEPVRRALVRLGTTAVFTDSNGRFEFHNVSAGPVAVTVRKPGYFGDEARPDGPPTVAQIGPDSRPLLLKLIPVGAISGRVTGVNDEPLENIVVQLLASTVANGRRGWQQSQTCATDEDGQYRLGSLLPGAYLIAATTPMLPVAELGDPSQPALGYPLRAFYPGVLERSSATTIQLAAGREFQADFSLHKQRVFRISGNVNGVAKDTGVNLQLAGSDGEVFRGPPQLDPGSGQFEFLAVPAGDYLLVANGFGPEGPSLSARKSLHLAADADHLVLTIEAASAIPVNVRIEYAGPRPEKQKKKKAGDDDDDDDGSLPVQVSLESTDNASLGAHVAEPETETAQVIHGAAPGRYKVQFETSDAYYVASATCGGTDLLRDPLTVAEGAETPPINITLRDQPAKLTVKWDGDSDNGARLLIISESRPTQSPLTPEVASSLLDLEPTLSGPLRIRESHGPPEPAPEPAQDEVPGQAHLEGLAPGDYTILAFDRLDDLEYARPDVLTPYLSQAAHVSLDRGGETTISVKLIRRAK